MFVSYYFLLFLAALWMIYAIVPGHWRKGILFLFSYGFLGFLSWKALVILFASTGLVYTTGKVIEKNKHNTAKAKKATIVSVALFAFLLIVWKNIPYVIKMFGISQVPEDSFLRTIVLPVGFSFYAFQAIGYLYDVYQGKEKAEENFVSFALYMGFFAKLVSGPIERKGKFAKQIEALANVNVWNAGRLSLALTYIVWGYFLKLVVADRLALIVNEVYKVPSVYDSVWLIGAAVFYSFQIYADFAGYTSIAIGCGLLFGLELTQNFKAPYLAVNVTDFWRRWHISLSSWLRDYLYIPLGGNRKGKLRKYLNTMIVFVICGIWHGNGLSFLVWGLLHGFFSVMDSVKKVVCAGKMEQLEGMGGKIKERLVTLCARIGTFLVVTFCWIFFRAESLTLALSYIRMMFTNGFHPFRPIGGFVENGIPMIQIYLSFVLILLVQLIDGISYKKDVPFPVIMQENNRLVRYGFFYVCLIAIFVIGIYGGAFQTETFIYMQF